MISTFKKLKYCKTEIMICKTSDTFSIYRSVSFPMGLICYCFAESHVHAHVLNKYHALQPLLKGGTSSLKNCTHNPDQLCGLREKWEQSWSIGRKWGTSLAEVVAQLRTIQWTEYGGSVVLRGRNLARVCRKLD